jgi:hypothetical protein
METKKAVDGEVIKPDELNGSPFDGIHKNTVPDNLPAKMDNPYLPMIKMIVEQKGDLAQLEKFMDLQDRWEKNEARKAFVNALTQFKANPPDIYKDTQVDFSSKKEGGGRVNYKYATLDQVSDKIGHALSVHGLSHRWDIKQIQGSVAVTCILTHVLGHSESVTMEGPSDMSGSKNPIQAVVSTTTYLQRSTLLAVSGCAVKGMDDDGRQGAGPNEDHTRGHDRSEASTPNHTQKASPNASQSQQQGSGTASSKMKFDVTQPLKFGKHKGKTPSDASIPPSWILFMLDKVDTATGDALVKIAHNKCDGFIMRYCDRNEASPVILEGQLNKRFGKSKLGELTLQEKVQYCEILEGSGK